MSPSRVTAHFDLREFACRDGTEVPAYGRSGLTLLCKEWLEPFRSQFGPVRVLSGFRTPAHNRAVGGASKSVHMMTTVLPSRPARSRTVAAAADVRAATGDVAAWARWAKEHRARNPHLAKKGRGGIGVYVGQGFVHLDTASNRDWTG